MIDVNCTISANCKNVSQNLKNILAPMKLFNILRIDFDRNRVYGLDILRAIAILFVVIGHGSVYLPNGLQNISNFFVFDGVSIFFVLSGYLIGGILIKQFDNKISTIRTLYNFWIRRWFRTLPNYYLILILLVLLNFIFHEQMGHPFEGGFKIIKYYFFFVQNINTPHPDFFPEAWSLSIEEWFYLLIPFLIFVCSRVLHFKTKNSILLIAILVIGFSTCFRYYRYINLPDSILEWDVNYRKQVLTRLDSLMFGLLGAFFSFYYKRIWTRYKRILLFIGIFILCIQHFSCYFIDLMNFPIYQCVYSFTITSIGTVFLIPFLSEYKMGDGRIYKAFTYISLISYSMYLLNLTLVHLYFVNFINKYVTHIPLILYFFYLTFTIIGSILLYKYFEKPFMNLREKLK